MRTLFGVDLTILTAIFSWRRRRFFTWISFEDELPTSR